MIHLFLGKEPHCPVPKSEDMNIDFTDLLRSFYFPRLGPAVRIKSQKGKECHFPGSGEGQQTG